MGIEFERLDLASVDWAALDLLPDRTIFQTRPWLDFVAETQGGEPLVAAVRQDGRALGFFTGLIFRRWGLRILGSPFPGWTTESMGFNLPEGAARADILREFAPFVFQELGCHHFELVDRPLGLSDCARLKAEYRACRSSEVDLSLPEDQLFASLDKGSCRWCIRKAQRSGVVIEEAHDLAFADDYFAQLEDVFAKQSLVPTYTVERVRTLIRHLLPTGRLLLLRARGPDGRCLATGIFPAMNRTMYFWGGASWREHQHLCPNELLMWQAMRHWKARGMSTLDMCGGGAYKRKYGGREVYRPWLRFSKYPALLRLRAAAKAAVDLRQRLLGMGKA